MKNLTPEPARQKTAMSSFLQLRLTFLKPSLLFLLLISCFASMGQGEPIDVQDIGSPSVPAMVILGNSTEEITRPSTFSALSASLVDALGEDGINSDVALEFTPFWMRDSLRTFESFYGIEDSTFGRCFGQGAMIWNSIKQSASFSIATQANTTVTPDGKTLSLGFRTNILSGKPSEAVLDGYKEMLLAADIRTVAAEIYAALDPNSTVVSFVESGQMEDKIKSVLGKDPKRYGSKELEAIEVVYEHFKNLLKNCKTDEERKAVFYDAQVYEKKDAVVKFIESYGSGAPRVGWIMEFAGATVADFPTNDIGLSYLDRSSVWLTNVYRSKMEGQVDFGLLLRYSWEKDAVLDGIFDAGLRFGLNLDHLVLSAEAIYKYNREPQALIEGQVYTQAAATGLKATLNANYQFSGYNSIYISIGKDYDYEGKTPVIATAGISVGLFKKQLVNFKS